MGLTIGQKILLGIWIPIAIFFFKVMWDAEWSKNKPSKKKEKRKSRKKNE